MIGKIISSITISLIFLLIYSLINPDPVDLRGNIIIGSTVVITILILRLLKTKTEIILMIGILVFIVLSSILWGLGIPYTSIAFIILILFFELWNIPRLSNITFLLFSILCIMETLCYFPLTSFVKIDPLSMLIFWTAFFICFVIIKESVKTIRLIYRINPDVTINHLRDLIIYALLTQSNLHSIKGIIQNSLLMNINRFNLIALLSDNLSSRNSSLQMSIDSITNYFSEYCHLDKIKLNNEIDIANIANSYSPILPSLLVNLLSNAVKYTSGRKRYVTISLTSECTRGRQFLLFDIQNPSTATSYPASGNLKLIQTLVKAIGGSISISTDGNVWRVWGKVGVEKSTTLIK